MMFANRKKDKCHDQDDQKIKAMMMKAYEDVELSSHFKERLKERIIAEENNYNQRVTEKGQD